MIRCTLTTNGKKEAGYVNKKDISEKKSFFYFFTKSPSGNLNRRAVSFDHRAEMVRHIVGRSVYGEKIVLRLEEGEL